MEGGTDGQRHGYRIGGVVVGAFYRFCRDWHGYLSAIAFVWLLFFSLTGILLNHPHWFNGLEAVTDERPIQAPVENLVAIRSSPQSGSAPIQFLLARSNLPGEVVSTDVVGDELFVRMRGAKGATDLRINLITGKGSASVQTASIMTLFKEMHRGEHAGPVWRALVDISGGVLSVTSLVGLMLYFSLRFRLRKSVLLIAAGALTMAVALILFVK
jgi:hypothetical protein